MTPQRQIILDTICAIGEHTTASDIFDRVHAIATHIDRATVYRTLAFFCDLNVLVSAEIEGKTVYEIAAPTPHHHLVCRNCGHVTTLTNHHLDQFVQYLIEKHHFQPEINHLTITGLCAACQGANKD
ncbi:MAG: transcriptional repressor [Ardenticatenaceae bacterium]|nr:transcriptional repressor [Ardenticatenaceae bacterium]MCB9445074.1 transcriptional repressor [Ardenticatenaceae bacterium]